METMILQLGWRNIWRNKRRTAVILAAVIIGVWSMIFMGALMRGIADQMVKNSIATLTGHIQIQKEGFRNDPVIEHFITAPEKLLPVLSRLPAGARWTPRIRVTAVAANARHSDGVVLAGIDPGREAKISFIGDAVYQGRYLREDDPYGIIVGRALLEKFGTRLGHKLVLMSQGADGEIASRAFRIVGVFRAEMQSTEKRLVFVTLPAAQAMLKTGGEVSEIAILLGNYREAPAVAANLRANIPDRTLQVYTWQELLPLVSSIMRMYDGFILVWFIVVFIAMGFGLVNTILMAVFERVREFGLLRSLGMKPRLVVAEVLAESFFLLAIGTIIGNLLGLASVWLLAGHGIDLSAFAQGMEFAGMSRIIFPVVYVRDVVTADLVVFLLGLLISMYPAVKAARFTPIEAMAHT
jgi:ABC-type lipoprotein release transport system permease subunit